MDVALAVNFERLAQDVVDGLARMQRGVGVLEDELQLAPVGAAPPAGGALAIDFQNGALRRNDPGDRLEQCRLARAGFADDPESFPLSNLERYVMDREDFPAARGGR